MNSRSQLIPLAALFAQLKLSGKDNAQSRDKIRRWYWCGVFGEAYRDGHLSRFAKDIVQVTDWILDDKKASIVEDVQIGAWNLMKAKSIQSAIYKGIIIIKSKK